SRAGNARARGAAAPARLIVTLCHTMLTNLFTLRVLGNTHEHLPDRGDAPWLCMRTSAPRVGRSRFNYRSAPALIDPAARSVPHRPHGPPLRRCWGADPAR